MHIYWEAPKNEVVSTAEKPRTIESISLEKLEKNFINHYPAKKQEIWEVINKYVEADGMKSTEEKTLLALKDKETTTGEEIIEALQKVFKKQLEAMMQEFQITLSPTKLTRNEIETLKNKDFLEIPFMQRLQYITEPKVDANDIVRKKVSSISFFFDHDGNGKDDGDLYYKTTAGQVIPYEVSQVLYEGKTFVREGLHGEFFSKGNKRLIIHTGTTVQIPDFSQADFDAAKTKIKAKYQSIEVGNKKKNEPFIREALARGFEARDIDFLVMLAHGKHISLSGDTIQDQVTREEFFSYLSRKRGANFQSFTTYTESGKEVSNDLLKIDFLQDVFGRDWKDKAKELSIEDDPNDINNSIQVASRSLNLNAQYRESTRWQGGEKRSNALQVLEQISENSKAHKILKTALWSIDTKNKIGAIHCTDWVDRIYKKSIGESVYRKPIFDGIRGQSGGNSKDTGIRVSKYATQEQVKSVIPGDHLVLDKPPYNTGRTHSIIAFGTVDSSGNLLVANYPNYKNAPPRFNVINVVNHKKIIRIQRA